MAETVYNHQSSIPPRLGNNQGRISSSSDCWRKNFKWYTHSKERAPCTTLYPMKTQWVQLDVEAASGLCLLQTHSQKGVFIRRLRCRCWSFATYKRLLAWTPTRHIPLTDLVHFTISYFPPEAILAAR